MRVPAVVAWLAGLGVAVGACSSKTDGLACECADPALTVTVPSDIAAAVSAVRLSGAACSGVAPQCANQTGGCSQYRFEAVAAGPCRVEVDFASGTTFVADVTIAHRADCCAGFYATPESAGQIQVPTPDGGGT